MNSEQPMHWRQAVDINVCTSQWREYRDQVCRCRSSWSPERFLANRNLWTCQTGSWSRICGALGLSTPPCAPVNSYRYGTDVTYRYGTGLTEVAPSSSGYGSGLATFDTRLLCLVMGWVTILRWGNHLSISQNNLCQLSLLPSAGQEMSTGQSAVMLCSWE